MKKILLLISLTLILLLSNCITAPMQSTLFTFADQHIYGYNAGNQVTSNKIVKSGESCSFSSWFIAMYFFYGAGGGIHEAKTNGGITKVAVVDKSSLNILGPLFYRECTVVWGE